jgi:hypothetical protein
MPGGGLTVDEVMAILPETPRRIAALTEGLTPTALHAALEPDAWSVNDVLAHLRACHDVLGGSILRIVAEESPTWRRLSPRTWIKRTDYPDWEFAPAFAAFHEQRTELLTVLEPLPPKSWDRFAMVTERDGKIEPRTVLYYGDWLADHERQHWEQLEEIVAAVRER